MARALPHMALSVVLFLLGMALSSFDGTAFGGTVLKFLAASPAILGGFWIQWRASAHVCGETDVDLRWFVLPPRLWLEKIVPLAFVLGAGLFLLVPMGQNVWPTPAFGVMLWSLTMTALAMLVLLTTNGISSVAAAQEVDVDMSGYSRVKGQVFLISLFLCLTVTIAVLMVLGPLSYLITMSLGVAEGWAMPFLIAVQVVLIWSAGSIAAAYLLEEKLWHTDFYN